MDRASLIARIGWICAVLDAAALAHVARYAAELDADQRERSTLTEAERVELARVFGS